VDDQDGQPIPNPAGVHLVDHGYQHRYSEGYVTSFITSIGLPVRDWPSFRDVADFNILLAAKY